MSLRSVMRPERSSSRLPDDARAQAEEERGVDDALVGEQVADLATRVAPCGTLTATVPWPSPLNGWKTRVGERADRPAAGRAGSRATIGRRRRRAGLCGLGGIARGPERTGGGHVLASADAAHAERLLAGTGSTLRPARAAALRLGLGLRFGARRARAPVGGGGAAAISPVRWRRRASRSRRARSRSSSERVAARRRRPCGRTGSCAVPSPASPRAARAAARESSRAASPPRAAAIDVVKRSSYSSTGTSHPTPPAAPRTRAPRASAAVSAPLSATRQPDDDPLDPALAHEPDDAVHPALACPGARPPRSASPASPWDRSRRIRSARCRSPAPARALASELALRSRRAPPRAPRRASSGSLAAGLRHRVAAAAAAAGHLRGDLDDLARLHAALDQRRRDRRDEVHAAVDGAAEHDRRASPSLPLTRSATSSSALASTPSTASASTQRAVDLRGPSRASAPTSTAPRRRGLRAPSWPRACSVERSASGTSLGLVRSDVGDLAQQPSCSRMQCDRLRPGERLDAAHVRRARGLGRDLEQADLRVERTCVPPHSSRE